MKIISFDVGIKNMAYCIFEVSGNTFEVSKWGIMDLIDSNKQEKQICGCLQTNGTRCKNQARFVRNAEYFCKKHAEKSGYPMYHKDYKKSALNKKSVIELQQDCQRLFIQSEKPTKSSYMKALSEHYEKNCLHPYKVLKVKCDDFDLIKLGQQIKVQGQNMFPQELSLVLIENQISPIANRMKTIQGMLAQFFIMDYENIDIKFISSQNKLKYFYKRITTNATNVTNAANTNNTNNTQNTGNRYKDNKKNGIIYCKELLEHYKQRKWMTVLDTTKKDDLADAFLQGVWYIENNIFSA